MNRTLWRVLPMTIALGFAALPLILSSLMTESEPTRFEQYLIVVNLAGWSIVMLALIVKQFADRRLRRFALRLGILPKKERGEDLISLLLKDVSRRERALSMPHLERRIHSSEELANALEEIVSVAQTLLEAESAELALYDRESGMYHSAFVRGRPFRTSAQAMLSGAVKKGTIEQQPDVLIHPISFAGNVLGTLRIALSEGRYPDGSDRKVLTLLAAQAALALTNAQYTEQLLRLKSASEESLRAKTGFLANLSHELRAPLGIILNGSEILLDGLCGEVSEEQRETLSMMHSNGEHLLALVNDVLDYAKIESGKLQPKSEDIDVHTLLKELTAVVRKQAVEKNHDLTLRMQHEVLAIRCDVRHFRQIIINLLTNAIKYTPDGGKIEVWCERASNNRIKLHVKDNGIGISQENHARVFTPFERVEHSYALSQGGTGLGMSLTKRLVERNGGRIDFSSELGKGTDVWVSFPSTTSEEFVHSEESGEEIEAPDGGGNRVLLLKSEDGDGAVLEKYLSSLNFTIVNALNDEEAIEAVVSNEIDLIVFESARFQDWIGDLIERFKYAFKGKKIPILLLTSRAFAFDVEDFLRLGVDRCLLKPARLVDIALTARQLIDRDYTGAIIDEEEVMPSAEEDRTKLEISTKKLIGVDDLLH